MNVRPAGPVFSPLDERLGLVPGSLTPRLHEQLVRLGTWVPFAQAAQLLEDFTDGSHVDPATVRRNTEAAGQAQVENQTRVVTQLEHECPPPPVGPAQLVLSADGAMVPLVGGEWAEVKTMVIGEVEPQVGPKGEPLAHLHAISYFSRLTDSTTFQRLALVETQRRGVTTAGQVGAVADGSEWIQTLVDFHRPDAVRILDFPHAGEHISAVGHSVWGEGTPATQTWLTQQLHTLKHTGPSALLAEIRQLAQAHPTQSDIQDNLAYLEKREAHMQYPVFQAQGWPIGSGATESGNKLVVEARLKGSGMHWARPHVDPMLALRNTVCNDRWNETWTQIECTLRQQDRRRRAERRQRRRVNCPNLPTIIRNDSVATGAPAVETSAPVQITGTTPVLEITPPAPKPIAARQPAPDHIWRRSPLGKAKYWR